MKQLPILIFTFFIAISASFAQYDEFGLHPNGLIYSETTMEQLQFIVDSLNTKFESCELNKVYYSKAQAKGHYIKLKGVGVLNAISDMKKGISYEQFMKKHPLAKSTKNLLFTRSQYTNYNDEEIIVFNGLVLGENYDKKIRKGYDEKWMSNDVKNTWLWDKNGSTVYAFFFETDLETQALPTIYASMVQYSDCMVDTNTQVFKEDAKESRFYNVTTMDRDIFFDYVSDFLPERPKYSSVNSKTYSEEVRAWDSIKTVITDSLSQLPKFKALLEAAVQEAQIIGATDDYFESLVAKYYSIDVALDLKRSRYVVGQCSQDNSPRLHAMNIAVVSAEATRWEVFLRAHLDIMNDNFSRMSDGSYAWARRQTYIKELEELGINVMDLLIGISLRIENPSQNHYYGSISRLGRAISETQNNELFETQMLEMIQDDTLDDYNRVLMYYLFLNYRYYLKDDTRKAESLEKLKIAVQGLPEYLSTQIEFED